MTIHVITHGAYSDYHIVGVVATPSNTDMKMLHDEWTQVYPRWGTHGTYQKDVEARCEAEAMLAVQGITYPNECSYEHEGHLFVQWLLKTGRAAPVMWQEHNCGD